MPCVLASALTAVATRPAMAWGDEGHEAIALLAVHYLHPDVLARVNGMLATDADNDLTAHDIASEATWADKFRDSSRHAKAQTGQWHFVDIELASPDETAACFGRPALAAGQAAYPGLAQDCVVDKADEFRRELVDPGTTATERLTALRFLLHFVGDLHQPLHSSDDSDRGGNSKLLSPAVGSSRNLHAFWDTAAVVSLGRDPQAVADRLATAITPAQMTAWSAGAPTDWAQEAFALAKSDAYGQLPPPGPNGKYTLTAGYETMASTDAALQLSRAGVRLAAILNLALAASK